MKHYCTGKTTWESGMCSEMESLKPVSCSRFLESVDLMLEVYYFNCRSTRHWYGGKEARMTCRMLWQKRQEVYAF